MSEDQKKTQELERKTSRDALILVVKAQGSLYSFLEQAWPFIYGRRSRFVGNWHIGAIAEHLEACHRGEIKNLLINVPPRSSKTSLISVAFPAWVWIEKPSVQFLYASYDYSLSNAQSLLCRRLIESPWYQEFWGSEFTLSHDQNTKTCFSNTQHGYRRAVSFGGAITGHGGDILICDDPNNVKEAESDISLESTIRWFCQEWSTRLNNSKEGINIVVQQRTHTKDISGYILNSGMSSEWVKLILPNEYESSRHCRTVILPSTEGQAWEDPRREEGVLLFPERFGEKETEKAKHLLGAYGYAGQYQQRPAPQEGGIFKQSSFRIWYGEIPRFSHILCSVDTALETKEESSYSACTTWGGVEYLDHTHVMLVGVFKDKLPFDELCERVRALSRDFRDNGDHPLTFNGRRNIPDIFIVENKTVGSPLASYLHNMGISVDLFEPGIYGSKLKRSHLVRHFLHNPKYKDSGIIWIPGHEKDNYNRLYRISRSFLDDVLIFPNGASSDVVDTMTQALLYLRDAHMIEHPSDKNAWGDDWS